MSHATHTTQHKAAQLQQCVYVSICPYIYPQKSPIHSAKERRTYFAKEPYIFRKIALYILQKSPIYSAKQPYIDLLLTEEASAGSYTCVYALCLLYIGIFGGLC